MFLCIDFGFEHKLKHVSVITRSGVEKFTWLPVVAASEKTWLVLLQFGTELATFNA
jgi:hypothetical protein